MKRRHQEFTSRANRQFVSEGIKKGRRPVLVGGGLIRSLGGWFEVKALRNMGFRENADERILGSGEFVNHLLKEADKGGRGECPVAVLWSRSKTANRESNC